MKQYCDGGEAILEAFRSLGLDYIISSPGSEWSPALGSQAAMLSTWGGRSISDH